MTEEKCYHCGDDCGSGEIIFDDHAFCCAGCKTVYEILQVNNLNEYYQLETQPGVKSIDKGNSDFDFLDNEEIAARLLLYRDQDISRISFSIPQIHCSSCIWLLENLTRLHQGVVRSVVDFSKKRADITFKNSEITLRQLVKLLSSIGYQPNLNEVSESNTKVLDKSIYYKIGVAGFCFGNIMLLAFPEYLGIDESFNDFKSFFGYISLVLSIPVFFYSGIDYIKNAIKGINQRFINIDIPIALGMIALFLRSAYEILTYTGAGYLDSLSGLIFFLLLGKWFQQKTYDSLSFERDYKSYFPIAVNKITNEALVPIKIEDLKIGDKIEIRNNELIPADAVLKKGEAYIDYSFVTGESKPVRKREGDILFAGGRQVGTKIELELVKEVNNSYLTQLWNQDIFQKENNSSDFNSLSNKVSKYFTIVILIISFFTFVFWWFNDPQMMWNALTAVLIVACPCALALSTPFTLGNMTRIMGRNGLYLKHTSVIEKLSNISSIVFDKTGTITHSGMMNVAYVGEKLSELEKIAIHSLVANSVHPLSISIKNYLQQKEIKKVIDFIEVPGNGLEGAVDNLKLKLGSAAFLNYSVDVQDEAKKSKVFVSFNNKIKGCFEFDQLYRLGLKETIKKLKAKYDIHLFTGDNNSQESYLMNELNISSLYFNQSPIDKLDNIKKMQQKGKKVLMIGDGLNDAGALKQSDVGIAISDNIHQFSPACDAILSAAKFVEIPYFISLAKKSISIIKWSFIISFLYNVIGISYAVTGMLSPIIAAILMPLSSITIVAFTTFSTNYIAKQKI